MYSDAGTGGARGALAPPIFGSSVNPIPTGGGQIIPTYYYWPPQIFSPSGITACHMHPIILKIGDDINSSSMTSPIT